MVVATLSTPPSVVVSSSSKYLPTMHPEQLNIRGQLLRITLLRRWVNRGAATLYLPSSSSPQCVRTCADGSAGESPDPPQRPAGSLGAEGIRRTRRSSAYRHPRRPPPGPHAPRQPTRPRTPERQCCPR